MYGPFCRGAIPAGAGKVQFIGRRCSTCAVCFFAVLRGDFEKPIDTERPRC